MKRSEVTELHYITHVANVGSIMRHGILSHNRAKKVGHTSVALPVVQERRRKYVPGGRLLHDYVNLYFNARNPMMYRVVKGGTAPSSEVVVLRVSQVILDLPNVVIADRNASSEYVAFSPSPHGIESIDSGPVFAHYWNDDDPIEKDRKTSLICAEVLVPEKVAPEYVFGLYVVSESVRTVMRGIVSTTAVQGLVVKPYMFFE